MSWWALTCSSSASSIFAKFVGYDKKLLVQGPLQDNLAGSDAGARRQAVSEVIDKYDMLQFSKVSTGQSQKQMQRSLAAMDVTG